MSTVQELRDKALEYVDGLYSACQRDVEALETQVAELKDELETDCPDCAKSDKLIDELEGRVDAVKWGNCRRGCPPAYTVDGFCSPACKMGAPRGEFVTVAA